MAQGSKPLWMDHISRAATQGKLPHAIILHGSADLMEAAQYLSAAYECTNGTEKPCLQCNACRKVMEKIHPDVMSIKTKEKKIKVESVRDFRKDVYICPNEGNHKVYIIEDANQLDAQGQNILLKTVEEGPDYASFVFCTDNISALLPTIRSRCVEILVSQDTTISEESNSLVDELLPLLLKKNKASVVAYLLGLEKKKKTREEMTAFFQTLENQLAKRAVSNQGDKLTRAQLIHMAEKCKEAKNLCEGNVGSGHLLGMLSICFHQELS